MENNLFTNNIVEPNGFGHLPMLHSKGAWKSGNKKKIDWLERQNKKPVIKVGYLPASQVGSDYIARLKAKIAAKGEESPLQYWENEYVPE